MIYIAFVLIIKIMRNPYQRKSASSIASTILPPQQQYKNFIETVVVQAKVYVLYQDGWALCSTPSGQQTLAVWQAKSMAQLLIRDKWADYQVEEVGLIPFVEKVIPFIRQQNTHLSLNLIPEGQNVLVSGRQFLIDLKSYLYQLYLQDPTMFQKQALPLPRKIRLNDQ